MASLSNITLDKICRNLKPLLFVLLAVFSSILVKADESQKNIVDFHVHVAGLGYGNSGCFVNEAMRNNYRFRFYLMAMGTSLKELEREGDQVIFQKISKAVTESKRVDKAMILSMDGVVDENGELDINKTQVYVPNDYVYEQTKKYNNLLFAASINPYRKDAIERLEKVKSQGAVVIKWIPSIMYIDPSDERIIPFYQKMVELNLPLLSHTGREKSFANAKDDLADPSRLALPLSLGVKVIAAHVATDGETDGQNNFDRILPLFQHYPNLYADISSLTQINKLGQIQKVLQHPELKGRLIYGTDWPLQFFPLISPWYHLDQLSLKQAFQISRIKNQWDRDVALKLAMGLDEAIFVRGEDVLLKKKEYKK